MGAAAMSASRDARSAQLQQGYAEWNGVDRTLSQGVELGGVQVGCPGVRSGERIAILSIATVLPVAGTSVQTLIHEGSGLSGQQINEADAIGLQGAGRNQVFGFWSGNTFQDDPTYTAGWIALGGDSTLTGDFMLIVRAPRR